MTFEQIRIELAEISVNIKVRHREIAYLCDGYLAEYNKPADISVCVSETEIDQELSISGNRHSRGYCETVCVYREIAEKLPFFDRFVFHGAAVSCGGRGVIFAAPSGVGKSTHVKLWKECFGDEIKVINGDKPIVGASDGKIFVYGSPWSGKEGWNCNASAELQSICVVRRGEKNRIFEIDPREYFDEIVRQIYIPKNGEALAKTFDILDEISQKVKFYLLECDVSKEAAHLSFNTLLK